jgi:beta-glucosidase
MTRRDFPDSFRFGAATAAYQIEGAWNEEGRSPCIWDAFAAIPGNTAGGESGARACGHYRLWREDVELLGRLGLDAYRFSISWSRVFPEGSGAANEAGMAFYDRLIDALLEKGIEPCATLYHWDLPQILQEKGGWGSRDSARWFSDYAEAMFAAFGDRVKTWYTLNEPWVVAWAGHYAGRHAPGLRDRALAVRVCHHLLLAHAAAVEAYRSTVQDGRIGIVLNLYPIIPAGDSPEDEAAARLLDGHHNRWWLDPVLKGSYPEDILAHYASLGAAPDIQSGDMERIRAARSDFLGVNYYFRKVVKAGGPDPLLPLEEIKPAGSYTAMNWESKPEAMVDLLSRIKKDYGDIPLSIAENGAAYEDRDIRDGVVEDEERRAFIEAHIAAARKALDLGVRLEGYFVWSLLDNYEWAHGYEKRFGLFRVDYATLERSWKRSALWYRDFLKS